MNGIYVITGGNMGNRLLNLQTCENALSAKLGWVRKASSIYSTAAWGKEDAPDYLNQVLYIETNEDADDCLTICLEIEQSMGRVRMNKWESRVIDVDILFFNKDVIDRPGLIIPHPEIINRRFVLVPLNEIAEHFVHPVLKKPVSLLLHECSDTLMVRLYHRNWGKEA